MRRVKYENVENEISSDCLLSLNIIWKKLVISVVNPTHKYGSVSLIMMILVSETYITLKPSSQLFCA
jgi:hypothetical protein